jgi:hypothetical protein
MPTVNSKARKHVYTTAVLRVKKQTKFATVAVAWTMTGTHDSPL